MELVVGIGLAEDVLEKKCLGTGGEEPLVLVLALVV